MEVSQKTKNRTTIQPSNCTSGNIPKTKNKNTNLKRLVHTNIHSRIIYNCQDMESIYLLTD